MKLKKILFQPKQLIDVNKYEHPTGTLATAFLKPAREENQYVWFGYVPHKIIYHILGQLSVSINDYTIYMNKQANNKNDNTKKKTPKVSTSK